MPALIEPTRRERLAELRNQLNQIEKELKNLQKQIVKDIKGCETSAAETIIGMVCTHTGLTPSELRSRCRLRERVDARRIAVKLISENTRLTLKKIGLLFFQDHATVLNNLRTFNNLYCTDRNFRFKYDTIKKALEWPKE